MVETVSAVLAGIAIFVAIASFAVSHRAVKANTHAAIMGRLFEINRLEIEHPELFEHLYEEFDPAAVQRGGPKGLSHYLFMLFNLYAEVFSQHERYGLFDEEEFGVWRGRIENDFRVRTFLLGYWRYECENFASEYTPDFKRFIDRRIERSTRSQTT